MSNLRTIGSDFAPLIFDIQPASTGFDELVDRLEIVWRAVESNPDLPKILVSVFRLQNVFC